MDNFIIMICLNEFMDHFLPSPPSRNYDWKRQAFSMIFIVNEKEKYPFLYDMQNEPSYPILFSCGPFSKEECNVHTNV